MKVERLDPAEEMIWLEKQEKISNEYLKTQGIESHGGLEIEWSIAPIVALWCCKLPEGACAWVICGDVPTDVLVSEERADPRDAMIAICDRWLDVAEHLRKGQQHPSIRIGDGLSEDKLAGLGVQLEERVRMFRSWAKSKAKWEVGYQ